MNCWSKFAHYNGNNWYQSNQYEICDANPWRILLVNAENAMTEMDTKCIHLHDLFNGLFSRTTWVSQYQKGKTILDFTEARNHWVAVASIGPYANHLHFNLDR